MAGCVNTDKHLWRKVKEDYYSPSIHVTKEDNIGINVSGTVIVKPIEEWFKLGYNKEIKMSKFNGCLQVLDNTNNMFSALKEEDCCCEYFYLYARNLGYFCSEAHINYCPFCGEKLDLLNISVNR